MYGHPRQPVGWWMVLDECCEMPGQLSARGNESLRLYSWKPHENPCFGPCEQPQRPPGGVGRQVAALRGRGAGVERAISHRSAWGGAGVARVRAISYSRLGVARAWCGLVLVPPGGGGVLECAHTSQRAPPISRTCLLASAWPVPPRTSPRHARATQAKQYLDRVWE
eukprot:gene8630-biopygen111